MKLQANRKEAYKFFADATVALAKMEENGIRVNRPHLTKAIRETEEKIRDNDRQMKEDKVYKEWSRRFGMNTNIDSVPQLGKVLEGMGFKSKFKTAKGNTQWNEEAISKIDLPFLKLMNDTKKLKKANGTYLKGILRETDSDGFLHPSYNLAGGWDDVKGSAKTYRSASSDPNFQNMPIRNKVIGALIRGCFIPREKMLGFEFDFGQIEVRIAGCYSKDPRLLAYINDPKSDMHFDMAMEIFMLKAHQVGRKTTRDASKNIFVFPEFYGSYYAKIASNLWEAMLKRKFTVEGTDKLVIDHLKEKGITRLGKCDPDHKPVKGTFEYHIAKVEDAFWNERFTGYRDWKKMIYEEYLKTGYIDMYTGFRCAGVYKRNQTGNFGIQGSAFHCLLWSIIELQKWIDKYKMKTRLTGQIHDCGLGDSPKNERQDFLDVAHEIMTERIKKHWSWIIVPLETEVDGYGEEETWNGKAPWKRNEKGIWCPVAA